MGYRPPVFMWIAEYEDGTCLPQFDPGTGEEHLFKEVDLSRLRAFGWYPFTVELAEKLKHRQVLVVPSSSSYVRLKLGDDQKLFQKKEQEIIDFSYRFCTRCGMTWYFKDEKAKSPPGLLVSSKRHVETGVFDGKEVKYVSAVCPRCGAFNTKKCSKCNVWISLRFLCSQCKKPLERNPETGEFLCAEHLKDFKKVPEFFCTKCGQIYLEVVKQFRDQMRRTTYVLGVEGSFCLRIDEEGNVEVE